jgi:tRNA (adenine58-N1)-methyltransferase non-catalytic subunit
MLNLANIRPNGKYVVVDDASGLIVAAVMAKLAGQLA